MKKNKGFTLVQTMVALGIMAMASVGLMKVTKQTAKTVKRAEVFQDAIAMEAKTAILLADSRNCAASLGVGQPVASNQSIAIRQELDDGTTQAIFAAGMTVYGDIDIRSVNLQEEPILFSAPSPTGLKSALIGIDITYRKKSPTLQQQETDFKKKLRNIIKVVVNAGNQLVECRSDTDNAIESAIKKLCEDLGGTYDVALGKCRGTDPTQPALNDIYVNVTGDNVTGPLGVQAPLTVDGPLAANQTTTLGGVTTLNGTTLLNAPMVTDGAGTITARSNITTENTSTLNTRGQLIADGSLTANQGLTSNGIINANRDVRVAAGNKICIGDRCLVLDGGCGPNEYSQGIKPDGSTDCVQIPSSACGAYEYITKVNADGSIVCGPIPESGRGACPGDGYLQGYEPNGQPICLEAKVRSKQCAPPLVMIGFLPDGEPNCVPPVNQNVSCNPPEVVLSYGPSGNAICGPPSNINNNCPEGSTLTGYDAAGNPLCEDPLANLSDSMQFEQVARGDAITTSDYDFCFLSEVRLEVRRTARSRMTCRVDRVGNKWKLVQSEKSMRSFDCKMRCVNFCPQARAGNWRATTVGGCRCGQGQVQGTQTVAVSCVGAKCGGTCDPATKPATTRSCACPRPCGPGLLRCPAFGNQCINPTQTACPGGFNRQ